jgi:hypothetical protein
MKKMTILIWVSIFLCPMISFGQVDPTNLEPSGPELQQPCYKVEWDLGSDNYLNKDCPTGSYTVKISERPGCNSGESIFCDRKVQLFFKKQKIATISNPDFPITISKDFADLDLSQINTPEDVAFQVKIILSCNFDDPPHPNGFFETEIFSEEQIVQVRSIGQQYKISKFTNEISVNGIFCNWVDVDEIRMCCNTNNSFSMNYNYSISESSVLENVLELKIGFSGKKDVSGITVQGSATEKYTVKNSTLTSEKNVFNQSFSLKAEDGVCKTPGFNINENIWVEETYEIIDCADTPNKLISSEEYKVPVNIEMVECIKSPRGGCPDAEIIIDSGSNGNNLMIACSGYIHATVSPASLENLFFVWEGPDGFISYDQSLEDVPFGQYKLTVSDECCNKYQETVYLCNGTEAGPWIKNKETGQYCREVKCFADDPGIIGNACDDVLYTECVDPEYGEDWNYNEALQKCEKEVYINEEIIDYLIKDPVIIDSYEDGLCIRSYFCESPNTNSALYEEQELPEFDDEIIFENETCYREVICFGENVEDVLDEEEAELGNDVQFDEWEQVCFREYICFGEVVEEERFEFEPEINWEFNILDFECEADEVECDGTEISISKITKDPEGIDWIFNTSDLVCDGEVYCDFGELCCEISIIPEWESEGEDPKCPTGTSIWYPICKDEKMDFYLCSINKPGLMIADDRSFKFEGEPVDFPKFKSYPHPFSDVLKVEYSSDEETDAILSLVNTSGMVVDRQEIRLNKGFNLIKLTQFNDAVSGVFMLKLEKPTGALLAKGTAVRIK